MIEAVTLRQALGGLASLNQFFIYELTPDPAHPGKTLKRPFRENVTHGSEDSRFWLDMTSAENYLSILRARNVPNTQYTLGFAITKDCGYWFVDVDSSVVEGKFTELGAWVYSLFPGACFEISSSGTGFHLFGKGVIPAHSSRDIARGLEFYTEGRGAAFGLSGQAWGSADTDHTHAMQTVWVPQLFPPKEISALTEGPRPDWRGPTDDAELLRRAMQSTSTKSAFGNGATFADLWENNIPVLALAYPDPGSADGVNRSSADMALAQHLAFWTGCDGPRIERLMLQSGLVRPKWREHATYLREHTITNAIGLQKGVCQDKEAPKPFERPTDSVSDPEGRDVIAQTLLFPSEQKDYFKGCVYVTDSHRVFSPRFGGMMLSTDQFNASYGGASFVLDSENASRTKKAFEALTQSQSVQFDKVRATTFRPDLPPGKIINLAGVDYLNSYWPETLDSVEGDVSIYRDHVSRLLPNPRDQEILISYMAAVVQNPGVKFAWCPVVQGAEGCGKGMLFRALAHAVGKTYTYYPNAKKLAAQFNDWIDEKLLIVVNEVRVDRSDTDSLDNLKELVSEEEIESEGKGKAKKIVNNFANFVMSTNHKDVFAGNFGGRRWAIFYAAQQTEEDVTSAGMDAAYFHRLKTFIDSKAGRAALRHWFANYPIQEALNPAKGAIRAPKTSSDGEVKEASRGLVENAILDAIHEDRPGFRKGWICWQEANTLMKEVGRGHLSMQQREAALASLGYVPHPKLKEKGWTNNKIGGKLLRIYVSKDHPTIMGNLSHAEICKIYEDAQYVNPISEFGSPYLVKR